MALGGSGLAREEADTGLALIEAIHDCNNIFGQCILRDIERARVAPLGVTESCRCFAADRLETTLTWSMPACCKDSKLFDLPCKVFTL